MTTTSTVTMFFIGNFADMDTNETDSDNENPNVVLGLHDALQFVDVSEVDVNDDGLIHDDENGTGDYLSYDTGSGTTTTALDSSSLYNADVLLGDGSTMSVPVLVIQSANGDVFISEYPANPLDGLAIQSISLVSLNTSNATGINAGASDVQNTSIVCYNAGTLIGTPDGEVPVEKLQPGDLVNTLDHGPQPIRWARSSDHPLEQVEPEAKPVLIAASALGHGLPTQDLIVSPQHRILVGGGGQLEVTFKTEAFAPAKSLTSLPGIRHMKGKQSITWIHFACDRHEVVTANGCLSESLLLGPMVVNGLTCKERQELTDIFGSAGTPDAALNGPAARECIMVGEVRRHLAKCMKEKGQRAAKEIKKWDRDLAMEQWEADRLGLPMANGNVPDLRVAC